MRKLRLRRVSAIVFTILTGVLGILSWLGIELSWFGIGESKSSGGNSSAEAEGVSQAPDPYLYVAQEGSRIARNQPCTGLLGFCLGQPISLATESLGADEESGFPVAGGVNDSGVAVTCHRWSPPRVIDSVSMCEAAGAITSIRVDSYSSRNLSLAGPLGLEIGLGSPVQYVAENSITEVLEVRPFRSLWLPSEGETMFAFDWFLPQEVEGSPENMLSVIGRYPGFPEPPAQCPGEDLQYSYEDVLVAEGLAPVTTVTVEQVTREELALAAPC